MQPKALGVVDGETLQSATQSGLTPEARTVLVEWLRDGGYADALVVVAAEDPELAVQ